MYLARVISQRQMLKLIRNNLAKPQHQISEDYGFFMVDGQGNDFGKLILTNYYFRKSLGYTEKDLKSKYVTDFMPTLIN